MGHLGEQGWRIGRDGAARFIPLNGQPAEPPLLLLRPAPPQVVSSADQQTMLLNAQGALPLSTLAPDKWRIAAVTAGGVSLLTLQPQQSPRVIALPQARADHLLLSPQGDLLYASEGSVLRVWQIGDEGATLRETQPQGEPPCSLHLLTGGQSLLNQDSRDVTQWFAIAGEHGPRLHEIRTFAGSSPTGLVATEAQRRVFATLAPDGTLKLFASKQSGPIVQRQLTPGVESLAFSLAGKALLLERAGSWQVVHISDPGSMSAGAASGKKSCMKTTPRPTGCGSPATRRTAISRNSV
ncbi:phosphate ABC transporter permease|nr:phosphate ABC transporter permease [Candidatus Pantoea persica]